MAMFDLSAGLHLPMFRHALGPACWSLFQGDWRILVWPKGMSASRTYRWSDKGVAVVMEPMEEADTAKPCGGLVVFSASLLAGRCPLLQGVLAVWAIVEACF